MSDGTDMIIQKATTDWPMETEMNNAKRIEGILQLLKLSAFLEEMDQGLPASRFKSFADELRENQSRRQLLEIFRRIHQSLDNGPGRIPDLYLAKPNGEPDIKRSDEYLETIRTIRRIARQSVPPWSYFIL